MAVVRIPTRRKKNVGDVVQNREFENGLGRNEAPYAPIVMASPATANAMIARRSVRASRAPSRMTPAIAPANTNAIHGKNTKFDRFPVGRM